MMPNVSLLRQVAGRIMTAAAVTMFSVAVLAADTVQIGSKIDTEGSLLGNIIQQVLEYHGVKTTNRISLGNTQVVRAAIISGAIDIYPEYSGNGAYFFSDENNPAWRSPQAGYQLVKKLDFERNQIVWLTPAPANNSWTIAIRGDMANANHLKTLTDLGHWITQGGKFKLAASAEFIERSSALPAFEQAYGFTLTQEQLLTLAGGDTTITIKAAAEQTSGVNAAMAYGTDGPVAALGLVTLLDDKNIQPVYAPTPIIRHDTLVKHPEIAQWLQPVFLSLDEPTLQRLNARIALEGRDARKVAADYLQQKGFIK